MEQKWFWGLILLAVFVLSASNTMLITIKLKQDTSEKPKEKAIWGGIPAEEGLSDLKLPVKRVVETYTESENCKFQVRVFEF